MTRSHKLSLLGSLGEGAAWGAPLLPVSSSVVGCWPVSLPFFFVVYPCLVSLSLVPSGCSGRIGQSAVAMARCCNAAAGSSAPDTNIALTLVWQIAACAKAQPALYSLSVNVHSWRSPRHSSEVYATIYTGYGRHRCH